MDTGGSCDVQRATLHRAHCAAGSALLRDVRASRAEAFLAVPGHGVTGGQFGDRTGPSWKVGAGSGMVPRRRCAVSGVTCQ
ncbi:hypothetical protein SAM23877_4317 [Streptomyces ambofaciens ATCC 23877]|uniref:Uncharacterized protein n=1 Tax=Streptomyces ambofaciens (strain ATCC 23877 / 3486 / DSM 40053 / JCM 4204 / NBRC 12836 / NRRL B-2516) TaxID=278992 RepID=A0A0K2AX05_STRA7|nr:hypothetical protein SAM23877_4317 [Streptomyces ambofaciens ATCC 23877]